MWCGSICGGVDTIRRDCRWNWLKRLPARLAAVVWYFLVGEKRRTRIGHENREPTAYQVLKQRVMLKRAEKNE